MRKIIFSVPPVLLRYRRVDLSRFHYSEYISGAAPTTVVNYEITCFIGLVVIVVNSHDRRIITYRARRAFNRREMVVGRNDLPKICETLRLDNGVA